MKKADQSDDDRWKNTAKAEELVAIAIAMLVVAAIAAGVYGFLG